jgi:hypothetical protein
MLFANPMKTQCKVWQTAFFAPLLVATSGLLRKIEAVCQPYEDAV